MRIEVIKPVSEMKLIEAKRETKWIEKGVLYEVVSKGLLHPALYNEQGVEPYVAQQFQPQGGLAYLLAEFSVFDYMRYAAVAQPSPFFCYVPKPGALVALPDYGLDKHLPRYRACIEKVLAQQKGALGQLAPEIAPAGPARFLLCMVLAVSSFGLGLF